MEPVDSDEIQLHITLPASNKVRVTLETISVDDDIDQGDRFELVDLTDGEVATSLGRAGSKAVGWYRQLSSFQLEQREIAALFFGLTLLLYLVTRFYNLANYPIFFFADEAVQVNEAADLIRNRLRGPTGILLPAYFKNVSQYNLGTTVYLQAIGYLLAGKSIWMARGLSVLMTTLGGIWLAFIFRDIYASKRWWVSLLLLAAVPAWFLHSRTAFETMTAASLYAGFLYYYMRYRQGDAKQLYWALLCGGLMFYAYNPARVVIVATGFLLLLSDLPYHWSRKWEIIWSPLLLVVLVLPYLRFSALFPEAFTQSLLVNQTFWVQEIPFSEKLAIYVQNYIAAFDPRYWFFEGHVEQIRHLMRGYGHYSWLTIPFLLWGLWLVIRHVGDYRYRIVLIALVAAPTGAGLVSIYITRLMMMVIPLTILTTLGLVDLLERLSHRFKRTDDVGRMAGWRGELGLSCLLFFVVGGFGIGMFADALRNGPSWYDDYGMSGYQFGASQVFGKVAEVKAAEPERDVYVSHIWANGTTELGRFYYDGNFPFRFASVESDFSATRLPLSDRPLFIIMAEEYEPFLNHERFTGQAIEDTILRPNGEPGFYLATGRYVDNIDAIFAEQKAESLRPDYAIIDIDGIPAEVTYSKLDMGRIEDLFDGDGLTITRTLINNPAVFEIHFSRPRKISGLQLSLRDRPTEVTVSVDPVAGGRTEPLMFETFLQGTIPEPDVEFYFEQTVEVQHMVVELLDLEQGEEGHVHVWDIGFLNDER